MIRETECLFLCPVILLDHETDDSSLERQILPEAKRDSGRFSERRTEANDKTR